MNINEKKTPKVADCVTFIVEHNFNNIFLKKMNFEISVRLQPIKLPLKKLSTTHCEITCWDA